MNTSKIEEKLNWNKVAAGLGIARQTLGVWRKRPDAPKTPNLKDWQTYVAKSGLGIRRGRASSPEREELLAEKLKREIALLDTRLARERRQVIPTDEIGGLLTRIADCQRKELIQWAEAETSMVIAGSGGDLGEIRDMMRRAVDRLCERMETGIGRWLDGKSD